MRFLITLKITTIEIRRTRFPIRRTEAQEEFHFFENVQMTFNDYCRMLII